VRFNRTGYWLLALFGLGGLAFLAVGFLIADPSGAFRIIGVCWVLTVFGLVGYAWQQSGKAKHERWLFENGLRGSARILEASSNTSVNNQPIMKLELVIDVPGQEPRRHSHRMLMSNFAAYRMRPGVVLPVHVNPDPRKPGDLLVRW
jgi:hypothetical protein